MRFVFEKFELSPDALIAFVKGLTRICVSHDPQGTKNLFEQFGIKCSITEDEK